MQQTPVLRSSTSGVCSSLQHVSVRKYGMRFTTTAPPSFIPNLHVPSTAFETLLVKFRHCQEIVHWLAVSSQHSKTSTRVLSFSFIGGSFLSRPVPSYPARYLAYFVHLTHSRLVIARSVLVTIYNSQETEQSKLQARPRQGHPTRRTSRRHATRSLRRRGISCGRPSHVNAHLLFRCKARPHSQGRAAAGSLLQLWKVPGRRGRCHGLSVTLQRERKKGRRRWSRRPFNE